MPSSTLSRIGNGFHNLLDHKYVNADYDISAVLEFESKWII